MQNFEVSVDYTDEPLGVITDTDTDNEYTAVYKIFVEKGEKNYVACSPDILGCIAADSTLDKTKERYRYALICHVEGTVEDCLPLPEPKTHEITADIYSAFLLRVRVSF